MFSHGLPGTCPFTYVRKVFVRLGQRVAQDKLQEDARTDGACQMCRVPLAISSEMVT